MELSHSKPLVSSKSPIKRSALSFHKKRLISGLVFTFLGFVIFSGMVFEKYIQSNLTKELQGNLQKIQELQSELNQYKILDKKKESILKAIAKLPKRYLFVQGVTKDTAKSLVDTFAASMKVDITSQIEQDDCKQTFSNISTDKAVCVKMLLNINKIDQNDISVKMHEYLSEFIPGFLVPIEVSARNDDNKYSYIMKYYWIYFDAKV